MKKIYNQLWEKAKPYYLKGRSYDIPHIEWLLKHAEKVLLIEPFDSDILFPVIILHDIGYSELNEKNPNIKNVESKVLHMAKGAVIAKKLMKELNFPEAQIEKISYLISVHDNWILGDDEPYKKLPELAVFNDLDFLSAMKDYEIFETTAKSQKLTPKEFYAKWIRDEKLTRRPFCCSYTENLWKSLLQKLEKHFI